MKILTAICLVMFLLGTTATAQFDMNGPNAEMTLQEVVPSVVDPANHNVDILVPGVFDMRINTNANPNIGLILLMSTLDPAGGNVFPTPWGGSLDIGSPGASPGGIVPIGDGIGLSVGPLDPFYGSNAGNALAGTPPQFILNLAANSSLAGTRMAFQAIVADPTQPPFSLDNTEAADANFRAGQVMTLTGLNFSTPAQIPFVSGNVFNFHGVSYTQLWVNNKGFVSFGGATSVPSGGYTIDTLNWLNSEPSIAAFMADWENAVAPEGLLYEEIGTSVRIAWGDPSSNPSGLSHYYGSDINRFEILLELQDPSFSNPNDGQFSVNLINIDPTATQQNGDGMLGHTPGGIAISGGAVNGDLHAPTTVGPGMAQIEEHNATGQNASIVGFDGIGTPRHYNSMHSWNGQSVTFTPTPYLLIPGDQGYSSVASAPAAPDAVGISPTGLDLAGIQVVHLIGKFNGFNDPSGLGGTVIFDPTGAALPGMVVGILDGSGQLAPAVPNTPSTSPFRDGEGLEIITPTFAGVGTIDCQVNFFSGETFTFPVTIVQANQLLTSYTFTNSQTHALSAGQTIDYYGTTYTDLHISQHGYITFGSANSDFSESMPEFFAGWQAAPTITPRPGVAVAWSDLNNFGTSPNWEVVEDSVTGTTEVRFLNQTYWDGGASAGDFSVTFGSFGPGSLTLDHTNFLAEPAPGGANAHDVIVGVTNGDSTVGTDVDLSNGAGTGFSGVVGSYLGLTGPESIGELIPVGIQPTMTVWSFIDAGDGVTIPFGTWTIL